VIVITGMHRSGTSLVAALLADAGFNIANSIPKDEHNPNGYFEDLDVMVKNSRILSFFGGTWDNPPDNMGGEWILVGTSWADAIKMKSRGAYTFDNECDAVKDPRFCLTYPMWDFGEHKLIKVKRSKKSVIKSLKKWHGWDKLRSARLYEIYNERMALIKHKQQITVKYEDLLKGDLTRLEKFVGKKLNPAIINPELNHG